MLSRKFTRRELVLLGVLAVTMLIGLYVLTVYRPVHQSLEQLENETLDTRMAIDLASVKLNQYTAMKSELSEIFALPEDEITVMPAYDNIRPLMVQLNDIIRGLDPQLVFDDVKQNDNVATRPIRFTFTSPSYSAARETLSRLTNTGWRCLMDSVTLSPGDSRDLLGGSLTVTGTISFYETVE